MVTKSNPPQSFNYNIVESGKVISIELFSCADSITATEIMNLLTKEFGTFFGTFAMEKTNVRPKVFNYFVFFNVKKEGDIILPFVRSYIRGIISQSN